MSNDFGSLDFDSLEPIVVPVKYQGKSYELREASDAAASQYENAKAKCIRIVDGQMAGVDGPMAETEALLVSLCLFDENDKPVPLALIRAWPKRMTKKLFEMAKRISEIDVEDEATLTKQMDQISKKLQALRLNKEQAKNVLGSITGGSD